jgi:hypothetical protein
MHVCMYMIGRRGNGGGVVQVPFELRYRRPPRVCIVLCRHVTHVLCGRDPSVIRQIFNAFASKQKFETGVARGMLASEGGGQGAGAGAGASTAAPGH